MALAALVLAVAVAALSWPRPDLPPERWLHEAGLVPREVVVDGRPLRYVRRGTGPAVILLHGFASSIYTWKDVLPALAEANDVVAFDLPGFGASAIPERVHADLFPRTVLAAADRLGLSRFAIVGNSLGGAFAVALAARAPGRVDRLVLVDAAGFNFAAADRPRLLRLLASPAGAVVERLPVRRAVVRSGLRQVFHDDALVTEERVDEYLRPFLRAGAVRAARQVLATPDTFGFPAILGAVRAPTLVVWGREDSWIPLADAERFRAAIPGARLHVIASCGHMPQEERPAEFVAVVAPFLR